MAMKKGTLNPYKINRGSYYMSASESDGAKSDPPASDINAPEIPVNESPAIPSEPATLPTIEQVEVVEEKRTPSSDSSNAPRQKSKLAPSKPKGFTPKSKSKEKGAYGRVSIYMNNDLLDRLDKTAKKYDTNRSAIIQQLIDEYL